MPNDTEKKIAQFEIEVQNIKKQLDDAQQCAKELHTISVEAARFKEQLQSLMQDTKELRAEMQQLTDRPSKRWETLITTGITALIAGLISFCLSQLL